jgi:hypothetical protein
LNDDNYDDDDDDDYDNSNNNNNTIATPETNVEISPSGYRVTGASSRNRFS